MTCSTVELPDGTLAIVCGRSERPRKLPSCRCGQPAPYLCDWKVQDDLLDAAAPKTCDTPVCQRCVEAVGPDKHLCVYHQEMHRRWRRQRATSANQGEPHV